VRFSRRASWDLASNELSVALAERRSRGLPLLDLAGSNPTLAGLGLPAEELRLLLSPQGLERYQPEPKGMPIAREAVRGYYRERGIGIDDIGSIVLSASSSETYSWIFKLLCDPGDSVLVPRPGYPLFDYLAGLENVAVEHYPSQWDGASWRIDLEALEAAIGGGTRAIVVVHPSNPSGAFLSPEEAQRIEAIAAAHGVAVIADEVFGDYGFERHRASRAGSLAGGDEPQASTFVLSGFSKVLALPQLKLGWTVVRGPGKEELLSRLEVIADTFLSVGTPVQLAAGELLARRGAIQDAIRSRLEENLRALRGALAPPSPMSLLEPEGGWAAVLRVPRLHSDLEWSLALVREGVHLQPGYFFDFADPGHLVASLLTPPADFDAGIRVLSRLVPP
jgi:alanine-synthesizing transaminase